MPRFISPEFIVSLYKMSLLFLTLIYASIAIAQPPLSDIIFSADFDSHRPPNADAGLNQNAFVGVPLALDGSASSDPDGDPLTFQWTVISRPVGSSAEVIEPSTSGPVFIADQAGSYGVELRVSDGEFVSSPASITIMATGTLASSALIGPSGGGVGLPDGASVLIPPNALAAMTTISIASGGPPPGEVLPPTAVHVGPVYTFAPSGQSFAKPVQIIVPYDAGLLPMGYSEGAISIYRQETWNEFNMVGSDTGDLEPENHGQTQDADDAQLSVHSLGFSAYGALAVDRSTLFTQVRLSEPTASVVVRRPPPSLRSQRPNFHNCRNSTGVPDNTQGNLATRTTSSIQAIVLHSTNNGQTGRNFNDELGWASESCNKYFAHYYIDRDGSIYQVADDLVETNHVKPSAALGVNNSNSIGIEQFNNVGEPFDGRQIAATIRLVDFLMEKYALVRPLRDATTGTVHRNHSLVSAGGDRILAHADVDTNKCDPSGTFMDSGVIKTERVSVPCKNAPTLPLPGGSSSAPALMDLVLDAASVLGRNRQHTGIVNTHGGDSFTTGVAGNAGSVTFTEDAAAVASQVGAGELTQVADNLPLVVAPGITFNLAGPGMHIYTDAIIAGTLTITGPIELRLTGSLYVSPVGKIIARDGLNGANVTVYSRGAPVIQGLLDARGEDGVSGIPNGGNGGNISFTYAAPGILLAPTIYARGGDSDTSDVSLGASGPSGGEGGAVTITVDDTHVVLGGGVGTVGGSSIAPPWRSGTVDSTLLLPSTKWMGDYLPPAPPTQMSSFVGTPANGERKPLRPSGNQIGFSRGLLTTGGMGGVGRASSAANRAGGPAGSGGSVQLNLGTNGILTSRDVDITTGADIETVTYRFYLPSFASLHLVCTAAGATGGFGQVFGSSGGDGGIGGAAGAITVIGGALYPLPTNFVSLAALKSFPTGLPLQNADDGCSNGSVVVGSVVEARDALGSPLYRLRLNNSGTSVLGGLGGIPSGKQTSGAPGNVGAPGASASVTGLPVQ